jgi:hypothetical protein
MTKGEQDLIVVSERGQAIRFNEEDVRAVGRTAAGVHAMRLDEGDYLTGADVVRPECRLLLITEKGYGKRTPLDEFRRQGRYGKGVRAMFIGDFTGKIVSARVVDEEDEVTFISTGGIILRTAVKLISLQSRHSRGVSVMDLKGSDVIVSVAIVREGYLSRINEGDVVEDGELAAPTAVEDEQDDQELSSSVLDIEEPDDQEHTSPTDDGDEIADSPDSIDSAFDEL